MSGRDLLFKDIFQLLLRQQTQHVRYTWVEKIKKNKEEKMKDRESEGGEREREVGQISKKTEIKSQTETERW